MKMNKLYETIGLLPRDIRIYELLYTKQGDVSLRTIAAISGMNRGTVYEVIKKLTILGLVTFREVGDRRRYAAAEPSVLMSLVQERQAELRLFEPYLLADINRLQAMRDSSVSAYFAQFYEGDEGVASILRDVLQTLDTTHTDHYDVISASDISTLLYSKFKTFTNRRIHMKLYVRVLADTRAVGTLKLAERRLLSNASVYEGGYMILYASKAAFITKNETNELTGIVINNPSIAAMCQTLFDAYWTTATIVE